MIVVNGKILKCPSCGGSDMKLLQNDEIADIKCNICNSYYTKDFIIKVLNGEIKVEKLNLGWLRRCQI